MESERRSVIDLTPDQVIAANLAASLRALGLPENAARPSEVSVNDRVLSAYKSAIKSAGRVVTALEVAQAGGMSHTLVAKCAARLVAEGRMIRATDDKSGKAVYIPKAEAA